VKVLWEKLHEKFFNFMIRQNLHFFMGMHSRQPTWLIIGLYYPPRDADIPVKNEGSFGLDRWM